MNLDRILIKIRPNAQWVLRGETLSDLEWLDKFQTKPTQAEIDIGQIQVDNEAYKKLREVAYPSLEDQLDSLWKCLKKLKADGINLGSDADAMITLINSVKAQFPKP